MQRLAQFDVSRRFSRPVSRIAAQVAFGAGCAGLMILARSMVDMWLPTAGPFALVYPTVLLATLYGHWRAGLAAYLIAYLWAWYVVLPRTHSFSFELATDSSRVAINAIAALIVLVFAEGFRRAVALAVEERDAEIEHRSMLLRELEHRTKNNFALVVSLLELQKRKGDARPEVSDALDLAIARIDSFARAYANLAESQGEGESVNMKPYLEEVVGRMTKAAFHEDVAVKLAAAECRLPREIAVAIGLFVNEALTNCAKYAFPDGRRGRVDVSLTDGGSGWTVIVADDGIGDGDGEGSMQDRSGLGTKLMNAFARQAQASYRTDCSGTGCRVSLTSD